MPEYKLQKLRGGFAIAAYDGGRRLSRRQLESRDAAGAAAEFERIKAELARPVDPDIRTLWEAYKEHMEGRRIALNMKGTGPAVLDFFGGVKPGDITLKLCRSYAEKRRALGRKNGTIRTELNQLRAVLLWARKAKHIHAAPDMELPPAADPRERHLTRAEFDRLLAAAADVPHLRLYLLLAIATAGRNAALLELTWDRVDFDRGLIYLGERNVLRPRKGRATVPMNGTLRAALTVAQQAKRRDEVIEWGGEKVASVRTALTKAAVRAKVAGVTPHVLRHTAAVWMAEAGHRMGEIAAFLGHADSSITERVYARYSPEHLRGAASALEVGGPRL